MLLHFILHLYSSIKFNKVDKTWHNLRYTALLPKKPSKTTAVCQQWWLWKIKMHIFRLCALGISCCFRPWSNLSVEGGTKKVNTCHSVSASLQASVVTGAFQWVKKKKEGKQEETIPPSFCNSATFLRGCIHLIMKNDQILCWWMNVSITSEREWLISSR